MSSVTKNRVHGPDVFEGDGDVDFKALAKSGAKFAIFKVSEGTYLDERATAARVNAIRDAKLIPGAYVFMRPKAGRSGAQEFRIFYQKARQIGLWKKGTKDLRPVLDCEASGYNTDTAWGRLRTRIYIRSAIRECLKLTGHRPIIYTGKWWWEETVACKWTLGCPLWLAAYPASPSVSRLPQPPSAWKAAALWQFTDHYNAPGVNNPCDYNVYVGKGGFAGFRERLTIAGS